MNFEYDRNKSETNKLKHGIDFVEAKILWKDGYMLEVKLSFSDEVRYLCIGKIAEKHYSAVITYRADIVRITSVRRSRKEEILAYEKS